MLSKCANPECTEKFLFLHLGKLFCLAPTPEIEAHPGAVSLLEERFWLCERCAKIMTIIWDGIEAKLMPRPQSTTQKKKPGASSEPFLRKRAARAGTDVA